MAPARCQDTLTPTFMYCLYCLQNLLNLGPCATNQVHVHPRAAEIVFHLAGGTLEVGIVEENGGKNTLVQALAAKCCSPKKPTACVNEDPSLDVHA